MLIQDINYIETVSENFVEGSASYANVGVSAHGKLLAYASSDGYVESKTLAADWGGFYYNKDKAYTSNKVLGVGYASVGIGYQIGAGF